MAANLPFERATPESQGVRSPAITAFIEGVEAKRLGLHSFLLLRHGRVIADAWWRPFVPDEPHVLYSLTKSFTSTAAGFAISEGRLGLDDQVISFFPRDVPKDASERWRALRVRHLLSMTTGHGEDPGASFLQHPPREWIRRLFDTPLLHEPGTHFVYNSTASHLVSMIVQKLTGQKLVNYLRDRLFRPLGITRPHWETDPLGFDWGGWGLYLRTDEIARFGQTLLQRGSWHGQQVIPAGWVDQATRKQVSNGNDRNSDWAQGYGFQFWMSRHGYRGDGAFGQFCVVLPQQDAVLVTTAASTDMQAILNVAWRTLLPALGASPLPAGPSELSSLQRRLEALEVARPHGEPSAAIERALAGQTFHFEANPLGWESLRLQPEGPILLLTLRASNVDHVIQCGRTGWERGNLALDMPEALPTAATARWTGDRRLEAAICYLNAAATRWLKVRFTGDTLKLHTALTGSFSSPEEITMRGKATSVAGGRALA